MYEQFSQSGSLESPTGAILQLYHEPALGDAKGIVAINHGLAEHAARYGRFAKFLSARGYHVYAHDHRGHGYTKVPEVSLGQFSKQVGWQRVLDDTLFVRNLAYQNHPGLPLVLFGHSMGGLIAMNSGLRAPDNIAALAVWNANFSAGALGRVAQLILGVEKMLLGSDVPSIMLPKLTFQDWAKKMPNARTAFDWLSRDPAEVDKYVADPLCGWDSSVSMWQDVFRLIFSGADDANYTKLSKNLPIHLRGGGKDPATEGGKATKALADRMNRMGFTNITTLVDPDNRHECLNDTNRQEVMDSFAAWLDATLA